MLGMVSSSLASALSSISLFSTISGFVLQFREVLNMYEIGTWQPVSASCGRLADSSLLPTHRRISRRTKSRKCGLEADYISRSGMRSFLFILVGHTQRPS